MTKDKGTKVLFVAIVMILIGGSAAFLFVSDDAGSQLPDSTERIQTPLHSSLQPTVAQVEIPLSATMDAVLTDLESGRENPYSNPKEAVASPEPEQEKPYFNREVKARLAQVADAFAEQIKYPTFSMPIPSHEALQKYIPNRSFDVERPLDIKDGNGPRIRLRTDKHQYFTGDIIKVTVSLSGVTGDPWVAVQARLVSEGKILSTADASAADQQAATYQMSFSGLGMIPGSGTGEYRVVARISLKGQEYEIGTPVSYVASVAEVTNVGMAQVSGEYLYIPVNVTTTKLGFHELNANLYSGQNGNPLVHLTAQQELQSRNGLMQLRAHIASLKAGGDAGPYLLKDIIFIRMPSPPDFTAEYGKSSQDSYTINGYAFDEYDDVPYIDDEAKKRLEVLRQLGSAN